jgi:cytochrome c-type biogenesis protein CcmE
MEKKMEELQPLQPIEAHPRQGNKLKFVIGGIVIVAAIIYLMVSSLSANVQYFLTVEELLNKQVAGELSGQNVRASGPVPDLLQNEAQAILTGKVLASGVFEADEILLKCPTKYEGSVPDQIESES